MRSLLIESCVQRCDHTTHAEAFPLIVEEALGAVLAPSMLHRVLEEALRSAELTSIPDQPGALRVFLEGALFSTLIQHVAVPDALEMVAQVRSALELALASAPDDRPTSDVREKITLPAPPARVIVVTSASLVVFLLADELGDDIDVVPVSTEADLLDRLQRFAERPLLVVVDRRHPAVEAAVAEELASRLGARHSVVWWTDDEDEHQWVLQQLEGGPKVARFRRGMGLADLGRLCRRLTFS